MPWRAGIIVRLCSCSSCSNFNVVLRSTSGAFNRVCAHEGMCQVSPCCTSLKKCSTYIIDVLQGHSPATGAPVAWPGPGCTCAWCACTAQGRSAWSANQSSCLACSSARATCSRYTCIARSQLRGCIPEAPFRVLSRHPSHRENVLNKLRCT